MFDGGGDGIPDWVEDWDGDGDVDVDDFFIDSAMMEEGWRLWRDTPQSGLSATQSCLITFVVMLGVLLCVLLLAAGM